MTKAYEKIWKDNPLQIIEVPTKDIVIVPELSGRSEFGRNPAKVKELTASIQSVGQLEPAIVGLNEHEEYGEIGAPILFVGFGRYEACVAAGRDLLCLYTDRPLSKLGDALVAGMHENTKRENLSPAQIAMNIKRLRAVGFKDAEIATKLGRSKGDISMHGKFVACQEDGTPLFNTYALNAIHRGDVSARQAYSFATMESAEKIDKAVRKAIDARKTGGKVASARAAREEVREHQTTTAGKKGKKNGKRNNTVGRTFPEVKKLLAEWDVAGTPPAVRKTVQAILDYIEGEKDEKQVEDALMKLAA
jgi:ParB/RepB/Spo0J family partition protein